jgi:hypothetical protein
LEEFRPGIMSKAEFGDNLIMVCMEIGAGREDTGHKHAFDQCGIVLEGQIEMFIGADRRLPTPTNPILYHQGNNMVGRPSRSQ